VDDDRFKIFSGTANPILAESICRHLDVPLGKALLGRFSEMFAERTFLSCSRATLQWIATCWNCC